MSATLPVVDLREPHPSGPAYDYILYGFRLRTWVKLTLQSVPSEGVADLEIAAGMPEWFEEAISQVKLDLIWIDIHELPGGWSYVRYDGMFDFVISPSGDRVFYRLLGEVTIESFQTYALGRIFSFAIVKKGFEPLHAATVVVNGRAVAFLGASAFGKSSLAACFIADGYRLLTDDVLRLEEQGRQFTAFPGPPRLKLLPRVARLYRRDVSIGIPINNKVLRSPKCVFSLPPEESCAEPVPLGVIYAVTAPRKVYRKQRITVSSLPAVEALVKILSFTHNHELTGRERLARQFDAARRLIDRVPVRALSYPRDLSSLPNVKDAILKDVRTYVDPL